MAKLTQLDIAIQCEEDVVGLDVTMNDTLGVQMLQTIQSLFNRLVSLERL